MTSFSTASSSTAIASASIEIESVVSPPCSGLVRGPNGLEIGTKVETASRGQVKGDMQIRSKVSLCLASATIALASRSVSIADRKWQMSAGLSGSNACATLTVVGTIRCSSPDCGSQSRQFELKLCRKSNLQIDTPSSSNEESHTASWSQ